MVSNLVYGHFKQAALNGTHPMIQCEAAVEACLKRALEKGAIESYYSKFLYPGAKSVHRTQFIIQGVLFKARYATMNKMTSDFILNIRGGDLNSYQHSMRFDFNASWIDAGHVANTLKPRFESFWNKFNIPVFSTVNEPRARIFLEALEEFLTASRPEFEAVYERRQRDNKFRPDRRPDPS